jgi:S-methylmethionine-dependent homocysteine/selenocysteine methylase
MLIGMNLLPQLAGDRLFITDGGLETTLIFHDHVDLPCFAAFRLMGEERGVQLFHEYFDSYLEIAEACGAGMILDTVTWRASPDWGKRLGYEPDEMYAVNRRAVMLARDIAERHESVEVVINGCMGPRGDGYVPRSLMSAEEAEDYHWVQASALADAGVDMLTALTIPYVEEGLGMVRAAQDVGVPIALSFTVETDGRLPSGQPLREAIEQVDAETAVGPAYFMINCAHPSHFADALADDGPWLERIGGIRANASAKSHAELDEADELDEGDPVELGADYQHLRSLLPNLTVVGGCCGTDHRHVAEICAAVGVAA